MRLTARHTTGVLFGVLILLNLLLTVAHTRTDSLSNDDFYLDPGHLYVKDARYAVIPFLTLVDTVFDSQHHARTLGWIVMAIGAALAATLFASLFDLKKTPLVGVSLLVSVALLTVPNYYWAPALWYNGFAFFGLAAAFWGQRKTRHGSVPAMLVWVGAVAFVFWSYQPFALIAVGVWLTQIIKTRGVPVFFRQRNPWLWAFLPPAIAAGTIVSVTATISAVVPTARLGAIGSQWSTPFDAISLWMFAYGRPSQMGIALAVGIVGLLLVIAVSRSWSLKSKRQSVGGILLLVFGAAGLLVAPLVLEDAKEVRFATAMLATVLIVWLAGLVAIGSDQDVIPPTRTSLVGFFLVSGGVSTAGSLVLFLTGYTQIGATAALSLGLGSLLVLAVFLLGLTRSFAFIGLVSLLGPLLISLSLARADLVDRWISLEADRALMGRIVLELSRLDFADETDLIVSLEIQGDIKWFSPLFRRVDVGGTEIVQEFASAIAPWNITVVTSTGNCAVPSGELVTATRTSDTEALVCVVFEND